MKSTAATFLLGALAGAAIALGVRAAILNLDDGPHSGHGDHASPKEHPGPVVRAGPAEHGGHGAAMPETPEAAPSGLLVDLGNEKCPIMGNDVNGKTWSEWNGLRVGHCCPPCIEKFLADPEKALDEAGIEWREAAAFVEAVKSATAAERQKLLTGAEYDVVRMPEGEK